jgi:SAM-dependent methyltransferase
MSKETSKAQRRRWREDHSSALPFKWFDVFRGEGVDVGAGNDKLPFQACRDFDTKDGDANKLSSYIPHDSLSYVAGSQALEHMHEPVAALHDWLKCVKPGGYVVQTIPSWELYEGMVWPSRSNPDHKSTWSMWQKGSPAPHHCKMPEWLEQFGCEVLLCRLVDDNYSYSVGTSRDQTWVEKDGVEAFIEFVLKKP